MVEREVQIGQAIITDAHIALSNRKTRRWKAVLTLVDVTQLKEVEKQSEQTTGDLKASNQELQQFAHIVSHDLKAPIRHIHSHCLQLKEELAGQNSDAGELLNLTTSCANHMIGLIEGLLAWAGRVGGGGAEMILRIWLCAPNGSRPANSG